VKCKIYSEFVISVKTVQENIIVSGNKGTNIQSVNSHVSYQIINYSPSFCKLNRRTLLTNVPQAYKQKTSGIEQYRQESTTEEVNVSPLKAILSLVFKSSASQGNLTCGLSHVF